MFDLTARWAIEFHSRNDIDGERRYFIWDYACPLLYKTRREAREAIREGWGYIARRPDLRTEPHGWRMPRAVRVRVTLTRLG